jgi:hypothetical protein
MAFSDNFAALTFARNTLPDLWPSFGDALSLIPPLNRDF